MSVVLIRIAAMVIAALVTVPVVMVGERAPSPSPSGSTHVGKLPVEGVVLPADSEAAPARPLVDGSGEDVVLLEEIQAMPVLAAPPAEPASTVTQSALTATVTAPVVVAPVPATAPAPQTDTSYEAEARYWIGVYFPGQEGKAYRVASCETGGTFHPGAVGRAGEQGIFQVIARYHGPVPGSIQGQAEQASGIVAKSGWGPWSCA